MQIHPIIMAVHLPAGALGPEPVESDVRAFLVQHPAGFTLIDTGMSAEPAMIGDRLADLGAQWSDVTDVLLTHDHPDHTTGLPRVRELAPTATVWGSPADSFAGAVSPLAHGTQVNGLEVLTLPGHTAGHLGFIDTTTGTVFAGDAVGSAHGHLSPAPAMFTADAAEATRSLQRLADATTSRLITSHGDEVDTPGQALRDLLAGT